MNSFFKNRVMVVEAEDALRDTYAQIIAGTGKFVVTYTCNKMSSSLSELKSPPDIILIDPAKGDFDMLKRVSARYPHVKILVCCQIPDDSFVFEILKVGIAGLILKDRDFESLINALEKISTGGAAISPSIARLIVESYRVNTQTILTKREVEILNLMAKGNTASQISACLEIAIDTSKKHIYNIYHKLKVNSRADAIRIATKERFIVNSHLRFSDSSLQSH